METSLTDARKQNTVLNLQKIPSLCEKESKMITKSNTLLYKAGRYHQSVLALMPVFTLITLPSTLHSSQ